MYVERRATDPSFWGSSVGFCVVLNSPRGLGYPGPRNPRVGPGWPEPL